MTTSADIIAAESFAKKQREKLAADKFARARDRVAAGFQPRCEWYGQHRHDLLKEENGQRIEVCMDCGGRPRAYPAHLSSKHAKVIEFPENQKLLAAAGAGGMR